MQLESLPETTSAMLNVLARIGDVEREVEIDVPDRETVDRLELDRYTYFPNPSLARRQRDLRERYPEGLIELERSAQTGEWSFTDETVASIREFFLNVQDVESRSAGAETILTPSLRIEAYLMRRSPSLVTNGLFGLAAWKWIGLLVIAFVGVLLDYTIRAILRAIWHRFARRRAGEVEKETLTRAVRPFGLFGAGLLWAVGLRLLGLPDVVLIALLVAVRLVITLAGVWAAYRIADLIAEFFARKAAHTTTKIDDLLIPLVRKTAKIFIAAMGVVYIANSLRIEIVPLLTGLGIGGLAFAFAAKDTIENFFGSVAVIVDRPFEVGDWVVIGDVEGTVETLGFRSTRIRTFYNSLVTVPNATLVRANVDNYGRRRFRRFKTHLGVAYDTNPDTIEAFCEGIRELVRLHPYTRKDYYQVWLHQFSPASLDILLYIFHDTPDWQTELRERHRLMLDILRLAHKLGVEIAFPTQTIHLRQDDAVTEPSSEFVTPKNAELKSMTEGRRAARDLTRDATWLESKPPPFDFRGEMAAGSAGDG
jgi:MscS family membrane protein